MKFYFLDHDGVYKYSRSDAIEFKHTVESMSFEGSFPLVGNVPSAGMLIAWLDDDDLWEVHEISTCSLDAFGDNVEITGSHIAITELSTVITASVKWKNVTAKNALNDVIGRQTQWKLGTLPATAEDDPVRKQRYRVTAKYIYLYAEARTTSKKIAKYKKKAYLTAVNIDGSTWWKMEGADGRVGWVNNPSSVIVRDGYAGDEDKKVNLEQKYISLWEMVSQIQKDTGYIIAPRVELTQAGIQNRYIDLRTSEPEYRGIRVTCSTNITDGALKYDVSNLYTGMVGVGKNDLNFSSITWTKAGGYPVNKPKGQIFVELEGAKTAYGHSGVGRIGVVHFDNETSAAELLAHTYDYLQVMGSPQVSLEGTIADLYALGYGGQAMRLYDKVYCILEPVGARVEMRITGLERDLVTPEKTKPTIGTISNDDVLADLASAKASATSIQSWQLTSGAVGNDVLAADSITADKIQAGAVVAQSIAAGAIVSEKLATGAVTTDTLAANSVTTAKLASGAVTADTIAANAVTAEKISSGTITTDKLDATQFNAKVGELVQANIGSANIDYAQIKYADIATGVLAQLIAQDAVTKRYYIDKLQVDNAQIVNATVANLVIKASDGNYYRLDVGADGSLTPTAVTPTDAQKEAGQVGNASIIETDLTAEDLGATNLKAINALIDKITAARLDVDELFARSATVEQLNTAKINHNQYIQASIDSAVGAFARLDDDGLHVGQKDSASEVLIDNDSVDIRMNGAVYSQLGSNFVQFGNYQLRKSADGGLVFKMK